MDKRPYEENLGDSSQQEATTQQQESERARAKRTRIRQACERCKSRKTKCNNQRPCAACSAAGVACTDWRPGEEPINISTTTQALENANYDFNQPQPVSLNELDPYIDPSLGRQMPDHLRSYNDQNGRRTGQDNVSGGVWPNVPAQDRNQRTTYPYDLLFRNERGLLESKSGSAGLSHSTYLLKNLQNLGSSEAIPTWPNKTNVRPVDTTKLVSTYDLVESQMSWKILMFMLIRPFLETTYVLWPTFHLPRFLSTLSSVKTDDDPVFICLLISIAFMALRERRTRKDLAEDTAIEFADLYWKIRTAEAGRDWSSPTAIQGMLYLSLGYTGGAWHQGVEMARTTLSEAVTKCFTTGLHRYQEVSAWREEVTEERKRTMWAVYCFDKMIAGSGRPPLLRLSDIDMSEITITNSALQERISPELPSLLAYHRTAIRLYMILERIVNKINMAACTPSSAINTISRDMGTRRYDESLPHRPGCEADHRSSHFTSELSLLDKYQYSDIPLPSRAIEDDSMYHLHLARIRSMSAFCRLLIASHLFGASNSDRQSGTPPDLRQTSDILRWSDELLESQRPAVEKGSYPDCGSTTVTQVAQVAKSLLPVIHIIQNHPGFGSDTTISLESCVASFQNAIQLLHLLRPKFDVVIRHLDPLVSYAQELGVALPYTSEGSAAARPDNTHGEELTAEALAVLANTNQLGGAEVQQQGQTSGSGAIQALLSLSGRTDEAGGDAGVEGADAWWSSLLNGSVEGFEQR